MLASLALAALWLAAMLPLAWPPLAAHAEALSRTALAALPWIACLGLPRAAGATRERGGARALGAALLALPPIALGLAIDLAGGAPPAGRALFAAEAWLAILVLALAAERAAGARLHAWAWLALVPGSTALCGALELGGGAAYGAAPAPVALLARLSPLGWCVRSLAEPSASLVALLGALALGLAAIAGNGQGRGAQVAGADGAPPARAGREAGP